MFRRRAAPKAKCAPSGGSEPHEVGSVGGKVQPPGRSQGEMRPLGGQRPVKRRSVEAKFVRIEGFAGIIPKPQDI